MPETHLVIDFGPNVLTFLLALITAIGTITATYFARQANVKIDQANSTLATNLATMAQAKEATAALAASREQAAH